MAQPTVLFAAPFCTVAALRFCSYAAVREAARHG